MTENEEKLRKHENAVQRLRQEAEAIKQRNIALDEEGKKELIIAEENRLRMSEQQKNAYFADWQRVKLEMALLQDQVTTKVKDEISAEVEKSSYFNDIHSEGIKNKIKEEVRLALLREKERQERAQQRLNYLDDNHAAHT